MYLFSCVRRSCVNEVNVSSNSGCVIKLKVIAMSLKVSKFVCDINKLYPSKKFWDQVREKKSRA